MGTLDQQNTATISDGRALHYNTDYQKLAFKFRAGATGNIDEVKLILSHAGTLPSYNMFVQICADNSGAPGTQNGSNSATQQPSSLAIPTYSAPPDITDGLEVSFTWSSNYPSVTSGTDYHIVWDCDGGYDSSNYVFWLESSTGATNQTTSKIWNGSGWNNSTVYARFKTYVADAEPPSTAIKDLIGGFIPYPR